VRRGVGWGVGWRVGVGGGGVVGGGRGIKRVTGYLEAISRGIG